MGANEKLAAAVGPEPLDVLSAACPTCEAVPGAPCRYVPHSTGGVLPVAPHVARSAQALNNRSAAARGEAPVVLTAHPMPVGVDNEGKIVMGNDNNARARVIELLAADPERLAAVVVDSLAFVGAMPEWDSETIEGLLIGFQPLLEDAGLPWVGETGNDDDALEFWVEVAADA